MRKFYSTGFLKSFFLFFFLAITAVSQATTYYSKATGNPNTLATWGTNADGTGTAPSNFTTSGDLFILRSASTLTTSTNWTVGATAGANVTLQIDGSLVISSKDNVILNGTVVFTNTSSTQVNVVGGSGANASSISINGTLKTNNVNGVSGANSSLPATAVGKVVTLSTTANYEFNGTSAQTTLGVPGTVNTLTINNAAGVNLTSAVTVTTLNIGTTTSNSIFSDNGKQITSGGTLNLTSGTFNIGSGATATSYPGFVSNNIAASTTVNYNSTSTQTIAAVNYANLTNSANGARILNPSGIIGISGTFSKGSGGYTVTSSTVSFNGTSAQTIPGPFTFNNLAINNTAGISSISGDITVNNSLALTNGVVTTGSNKIYLPNTVASRTNGWIAGNLEQKISAGGGTYLFPIGDATNYRPLTLNFSSAIAGTIKAGITQTDGLHPQIATSGLNSAKTLQRYWTLISNGVTGIYDATFGFVSTDNSGGGATGSFVVRNYTASTWNATTTGTKTATTTQATGLTTFGEFSIGEISGVPVATAPANVAVCVANNTSFTSTSSSAPTPTVKWQRSLDNGANWVDITAALDGGGKYTNFTTSTLNITAATFAMNGYRYRAVYTNINGSGNSAEGILTVTQQPTITLLDYAGSPFANIINTYQPVTLNGTNAYTGGTFSSDAGLDINISTGGIKPSTSTVGNHTVTYTIAAAGGCGAVSASTVISITTAPTAQISYSGNPFCENFVGTKAVTITGTGTYTGGTYSSSSPNLTLNTTDGTITPGTSSPGTYTVTYTIPAFGGHPASTTTTDVTITRVPSVMISYLNGPFCTSDESANQVTFSNLVGAYTGGTFSGPGLAIDNLSGAITPSGSSGGTHTVTYTIPASGGCAAVPVTVNVDIVVRPSANLTYAGTPFCQASTSESPTLTGTSGGTYSALPAGLSINSSSGVINPSTSTIGDYIVYYTIPASGPCGVVQITADVSVIASPAITTFEYANQPYCNAGGNKSVDLQGTGNYSGGTYSAPSGLSINPTTGAISPSGSTPGIYTVTYTTPNCPLQATTQVEITAAPTATISYGTSPFCLSEGTAQAVTFSGDLGGTFSAPIGVSIDAVSGAITPSTSSAGTYNISYTLPASGTCPAVTKTASITITAPPTAIVSYSGSPYCTSAGSAQSATLNGTSAYTGGTFSAPAGLTINNSTGAITPGSSTPGTYTVTYVTPTSGGCSPFTATTSVTITALPTAAISYTGPFCMSEATGQPVTLTGTGNYTGGTYSAPAALNIDGSGTVYPSLSTPGTYTVTYTAPASNGCNSVIATTSVTINPLPTASISGGTTICQGATSPLITFTGATGTAPYTFTYNINGGSNLTVTTVSGNSVTISAPTSTSGTFDYNLISVSDSKSCNQLQTGTATVVVNPLPIITLAATAASVCQNTLAQTTSLTYSSTTNTPTTYSIVWNTSPANSFAAVTNALLNTSPIIINVPANTAPGTYTGTLTVKNANSCNSNPGVTFTITVNPLPTITPAATTASVCASSSVQSTTLSYTATNSPTTYSIVWNASPANSFAGVTNAALSGSPINIAVPANTAPGTYTGTITVSNANNCVSALGKTFTLTVNPNAAISLTSAATTNAQTVCINAPITNITYNIGGGGTGATVSGLPTGVSGSYSGGVFTISGSPTVSGGPFTYTVNTTGTCTQTSATGTITVNPASVGGAISPALTTNCSSSAAGTINLSGNTGTILKWQSSLNGGATWTDITNTTSSYNYNVTVTTIYRAVIQNGVCSPVNSAVGVVSVIPAFKPAPVIATPTAICAGQTSIISSGTGYPTIGIADTSGDFHNANPPGWCVDKDCSGSVLPANGDNTANGVWRETNSHTFNGIAFSRPDKFAIVNGNFNSILETPVFSLIAQPSGLLNFLQAYNLLSTSARVKIELSTDGGTTYPNVLQDISGVTSYGISGAASSLTASTLDLTNYLGLSNLRLRFSYTGSANSVWALDNVKVPGNLPITYTWSEPPSGSPTIITPVTQTPITVQPSVTTTYTITTYVGGCLSGSENVTITVYPLPTITLGTNPSICSGITTANLPFTATTNTPNKYSIVYNAAAITAGLVNVTNATFPATSPISLTVPAGITPGTYNGSISVSNINNCGSTSVPFTITVRPLPTASISGGNFCKVGTTTLTVSNTTGGPFTGASFTATPVGLSINSGTGVIDLAASTAGTYTVSYSYVGANGCSNSAGSSNSTVVINSISSITSQPSDLIFCPESNTATFSVAATGASIYQWQYRPNSSSAWVNVPASTPYSGETTNALTVTTPTYIARAGLDGYQYQVLLNPSSACPVTSGFATLSVRNIWKGITSKDWNTSSNWSGGLIPTLTCENVIVLASTPMGDPILSTGPAGEVNSLIIMPGATVTVTGNTLKIAGTITDDDNALNATNGKIELNGNIGLNGVGTRPAQTIAGRMFATPKATKSGRIKDLQISNPKGVTVAAPTVTDTLNITGHLSFGVVSGVTFTTNDNVTLISDANGTASVDEIAINGSGNAVNNFSGKMIVERFIPGHRAWRLLTTPLVTSQTINQAWQEGAVNQTLPYASNNNPHPGYGTHITGIAGGTDWAIGYDMGPFNNYSLKVHDRARNTYLIDGYRGIEQVYPSAPGMNTPINYLEGYMVFVRGGRDIDLNLNTAAPPTNTVLRAKGTLKTGTQTITQTVTGFNLVGNPFASTLNLSKIKQDGVAPEFVYVYDPRAGSIGNFQTLFLTGGSYSPIPGGGSYAAPYNISGNNIQSGQAFFVQSIVPGSVVIKEEAKDLTANSMVFSPVTQPQQLRTNLYVVNTSTDLLDATLTQYSSDGNNAIDGKDAMKIPAIGAGTYLGMLRDGKNLIIERRQSITANDTIFYNLMTASKRNYRFEFVVDNMELDGLSAFVEDAYLKTSTPVNLNGTTTLDFTVNTDAASAASDRFRLVFKAKVIPPPLPFTFKNVQANLQTNDIAVKWLTENESDIKSYDIETSANGLQFVTSATITSKRGKAIEDYQWLDTDTKPGMHYYRIRSVNDKGDVVYSTIVSVNINIVTSRRDIKVYPNPVTEGRINVMFMNQPEGNYNLRLVNALGQVILTKQVYHAAGSSMKILRVSKNMVDGIYKLEITRPDKSTYNINVILQ